jgi:ElaB/YqjD/DUF883 family membrane-anchored ribosome-binding protein
MFNTTLNKQQRENSVATLNSDTLDKANKSMTDLQTRAQVAEKSLDRVSRDIGERIGALASDVTNSATGYVKTSSDYVRDNPVKGVAIAAAAGVVAGSIFTMMLRRSSK